MLTKMNLQTIRIKRLESTLITLELHGSMFQHMLFKIIPPRRRIRTENTLQKVPVVFAHVVLQFVRPRTPVLAHGTIQQFPGMFSGVHGEFVAPNRFVVTVVATKHVARVDLGNENEQINTS